MSSGKFEKIGNGFMNYFCTLFDSHYLSRGLTMLESLKASTDNFHIYVFAFDDVCYEFLKQENLPYATIISLSEFEDDELLSIKESRSKGEYCWTCTPSTILYCLEKFNLPLCTYIDADLYFYSDPDILIKEMGNESVLITEHRYTREYDQSKTGGVYCVQFISFRRNDLGMTALRWWRDACISWCYARYEDGKFGDQKYLDDWTERFKGVHVLKHLGGGIAPWNVQQYQLNTDRSGILDVKSASGEHYPAVFYHFHNLKIYHGNRLELGGYYLSPAVKKIIYQPYLSHLLKVEKYISTKEKYAGKISSLSSASWDWKTPLRIIKQKLKGSYNKYDLSRFMETKWLK